MKVSSKTSDLVTFEEVYVSYFSRMKHFAMEYVLSEEDAENIVQDVFMELWEHRDYLSYNLNLVAFLFTSIKNKCIDFLRHKLIAKRVMDEMQEEYQLTLKLKLASLEAFNQSVFSEEDVEKLATEIINSLPEKCREIFIKSRIEGKKQKDIAMEMNISPKTVENQMNIAYKKLRFSLKDYLPLLLYLLG